MAIALLWSGPEVPGDGATGLADAIGFDGGTGTSFAGVAGAELVGANELAVGAGAALV
jgi:hypothetical protein